MRKSGKKIIDFTLIYNRYKNGLYYYVLKMISDKLTAEDIVQNTFLSLYESIDRIENRDSVKHWLYTSARNKVYNHYRAMKYRKTEELDDVTGHGNPDIEYERKELKELLKKEIEKLSDDQREIIIMREYSQLSYSEIAGILKIDINLVKSRLFKARKKLSNLLRDKIDV